MQTLNLKNIHDLENKKVSRLLWDYAIPAIIGTAAIALYNFIDSIYIGHADGLGDHAIGGLGVLLPIMNIISGIGMLVGAGAATRVSLYLGQKNKDGAEKVLGTSVILALLLTSVFIIATYWFIDPILYLSGATTETYPFAKEFLVYYLPGNLFLTTNFALNSAMRASGYPKRAMYMMLIGVVFNIILAPIFIFILEWGMKGAALATNLSIFIGLSFVIFHFLNKNNSIALYWNKIKLDLKIAWSIINIGFAPFFILLASSAIVIVINQQLAKYGGSIAIESYVMGNRIVMVFIMILVGLTQGMQPIISYNYGAENIKRVKETLVYTIKIGVFIGFLGLIIGVLFPKPTLSLFNPSPNLLKLSSNALTIMTLTLPLSGLQMVISGYFQCIGKAVYAFFLSMIRQFVILVPALYLLPPYFSLNGIWASIPLSDMLSTIIAVIIFLYTQKSILTTYKP